MSSGTSNKPIVFVFGAKKGDADARKRNLSAINTQVAFRAHERRREKNLKSRQRAQVKENEQVDQPTSASASDVSPTSATKAESTIDFNHLPPQTSSKPNGVDGATSPTHPSLQSDPSPRPVATISTTAFSINPVATNRPINLHPSRRESDLASNISSDRETVSNDVWSTSPVSARHSTPATELSSSSPLVPVSINAYFDSALDPFFKLPAVASDREKWLVHFCTYSIPLPFEQTTNELRFSRDGPRRVWNTFQCPLLS